MWKEHTYVLGDYKGYTYHLSVKVFPDCNNINEFSVNIYFKDPKNFEKKEIVRIDNSHGYPHMHKFFRKDNPTKKISMNVWKAWGHLENNWKNYVDKYRNK